MTQEKLTSMRALASRVRRWHTFPVIHQETVGEHTHRVCTLYLELFGTPRVEVLEYILCHDMGELSAGDLPFLAKRDVPEMKHFMDHAEARGLHRLRITLPELTVEEYARFKLCDMLQMLEFARVEMQMGNQFARVVQDNILAALRGDWKDIPSDEIAAAAVAVMCGTPVRNEDTA